MADVDLGEYLKSEQARADMTKLIADLPRRQRQTGGIKPDGQAALTINKYTMAILGRDGAWIRIRLNTRNDQDLCIWELAATAYFRPDDDRFIVSDLSEGIRALRLRSAVDPLRIDELVRGLLGPDPYFVDGPWLCLNNELGMIRSVASDKLPDAICRAMLASWLVANLPVIP